MEWRLGVTESLLSGAESSEVGSGLWNDIIKLRASVCVSSIVLQLPYKLELDGSDWRAVGRDLEEYVGHFD